jgi:hypothetical protein
LLATKPAMSPRMIHAIIDMRFSGVNDGAGTAHLRCRHRNFHRKSGLKSQ